LESDTATVTETAPPADPPEAPAPEAAPPEAPPSEKWEKALIQPPEPGIHYNVPDNVYHSWEGLSSHRLGQLCEGDTCGRLRYDMQHNKPPTEDQNIGTAAHYKVLEPDLFEERVVEGLHHDRKSKANKQAWANFEKENAGKIILKPDNYEKGQKWADRIMDHPTAGGLRRMAKAVELSLIWMFMGVYCKARIDMWVPELQAIVDIKTGKETNDKSFEKAACNYGYHRQGAFYLEGAKACGLDAKHFILIILEKPAPCWVKVRRLKESVIWAGEDALAPEKVKMAKCYKTGHWPGYSDDIEDLDLPDWKIRELVREGRRLQVQRRREPRGQ
jgi:hypothetical protein